MSPISVNFGICSQQVLNSHDPLTPWHRHWRFMFWLIAWKSRKMLCDRTIHSRTNLTTDFIIVQIHQISHITLLFELIAFESVEKLFCKLDAIGKIIRTTAPRKCILIVVCGRNVLEKVPCTINHIIIVATDGDKTFSENVYVFVVDKSPGQANATNGKTWGLFRLFSKNTTTICAFVSH